ncbi:MAG: DEAD/DEAH box helicase [Thermoanaerobaculia bacterium]
MSDSIVNYDRTLPEIPGRCPWEKPESFLVKDEKATGGWRIDSSGRRPSKLLLVKKLRAEVDRWREGDPEHGVDPYAGASDVTRRLFEHWFLEDHSVPGFQAPFRFHFCQREAIETLAYAVEIYGKRDSEDLIRDWGEIFRKDLFEKSVEFTTSMDGRRRIRRYFAELEAEGEQDLPPVDLRRYAFRMATGSGKTWVMAMAIVWAYFHRMKVLDSPLASNFLVVAPNVIVYQRLEKDLAGGEVFRALPLIPPEWKADFQLRVILRGEGTEPSSSGNLFVTNIQQAYERDKSWTPQNAVDAILGRRPVADLASQRRSILDRLKTLPDLVVLNDEAHHVHDEDLAWAQALLAVHSSLPKGLALWLDFSATPKDQNGTYYPWTLCDYPLAQAVEDRIVKAPIIVTKEDDPKLPKRDLGTITKENVAAKYGYWIQAAVERLRVHEKAYGRLGLKPVLFIMAEKSVYADAIGKHLLETSEYGLKEKDILIIHTDASGEVLKGNLDLLRAMARDIDKPGNTIKVIVSVMMLTEGWDVRGVSVVLGLRPFNSTRKILPEQVVGRGLRLMGGAIPDRTQTLEVLGTANLIDFLRRQLEAEGVGFGVEKKGPPDPIMIEPVRENLRYDIHLPVSKPRLIRNVRKLDEVDPLALDPVWQEASLAEEIRIHLRMTFGPTDSEVHAVDILTAVFPGATNLLESITRLVLGRTALTAAFAQVYPVVKIYVRDRCFGRTVDLDDKAVQSHLQNPEVREGIAEYLGKAIGAATVEEGELEFVKADFRLSQTKPFSWRRDLPALQAKHTVFNFVATYNKYERRFAEFLDSASDVLRFASLGTTEQGDSGAQFRVDYLKESGAIGFYHPDFVAVQATALEGEISWILETKGRVWAGTEAKDKAMTDWCERVTRQTGRAWRFARINQVDFESRKPKRLSDLVDVSTLAGDRVAQPKR